MKIIESAQKALSDEIEGLSLLKEFFNSDFEKAVDIAMAAKYRNNGQVCISPSRFYIHESKKNNLQNLLLKKL